MPLKEEIIATLPEGSNGMHAFLRKQGEEFCTELFDECGHLIGPENATSAVVLADAMPRRFGRPTTRFHKVRAVLAYLIAEGAITGQPQVFNVAGQYHF